MQNYGKTEYVTGNYQVMTADQHCGTSSNGCKRAASLSLDTALLTRGRCHDKTPPEVKSAQGTQPFKFGRIREAPSTEWLRHNKMFVVHSNLKCLLFTRI